MTIQWQLQEKEITQFKSYNNLISVEVVYLSLLPTIPPQKMDEDALLKPK